jgi:small subunit ribosomal protein S1
MSDDIVDENTHEEENFADLLESYSSRIKAHIQVGDKVKGEIISIGRDTVFVDTGTKIDGLVEKEELLDENGELPYKEGDILELYAVAFTGSEIRLSKALSGIGGLAALEEAFENAVPVEGKVKGEVKGGFHVDIMQRRAFCPISQMDLKYVETPNDYVGETHQFLITQFEDDGGNIVLSRRALLNREQEKARSDFLGEIEVDAQLEGKITKLMPYGAFVELFPGLEGMVHLSELSWSRVDKPGETFKTGDLVPVKIIGIEKGEKPDRPKISLSIKQVTGDPWERVCEEFQEGDKVTGKVTRCSNFGAFVEIAPGIEGLVHISEMSYTKRVVKPENEVKAGETVSVMVKQVDPSKRRISLSIKDAEGDPWLEVLEKYRVGQAVEGKIEKKEKFGYFITLEPGITGLLPKSGFKKSYEPKSIEKLRPGDAVSVVIEEIKPDDRRITLGPGDSRNEDNWRKFTEGTRKSLGSLGEKLQQALNSKKDAPE